MERFAKIAETHQSNPRQISLAVLSKIGQALMMGAEMIPTLSPWVSMARSVATAAFSSIRDPRSSLQNYDGPLSDLKWFQGVSQVKWSDFPDQEVQDKYLLWQIATENLVDMMTIHNQIALSHHKTYQSCKIVEKVRGGCKELIYIHPETGEAFDHEVYKRKQKDREEQSFRSLSRK
jgi:hypothetical protein